LEPRHLFAEVCDFLREDDRGFRLGSDQVFNLGQPPARIPAAA
jgi:hypothetical protein